MECKFIITRQLTSGDDLTIPVCHFSGSDKDAPSLYLQSSIHGAETQGYWVALHLLEYFSQHPPKGDVTIVPLANPYGLNSKMGEATFGRFDPVSGDNWNRYYADLTDMLPYGDFINQHGDKHLVEMVMQFKHLMQTTLAHLLEQPQFYAKQLNYQLQQLACQADIVLDLHCDTQSQPHIYSPVYALESARQLNLPFVLAVPHQFAGALDEAIFCPWWRLTQLLNAHYGEERVVRPAAEAFTIELGGQEYIDQQAAQFQASAILSYCNVKGVCDAPTIEPRQVTTAALDDFVTLYAPAGGLIIDTAPLGQPVERNQPLVKISQPKTVCQLETLAQCRADSCITISYPQRCIPITHIDSSNVHQGMAVMKIIRQ